MKPTVEELETRTREFAEESRRKGLSVTHQRLAIFRELASTDTHPTAEDIFGKLRKQFSTLSFATVYKTLETFEKFGFVSKTRSTGERARYDANRMLHHHLICRECGRIEDYYHEALARLSVPRNVRSNFKVEEYRIDFRGLCGSCRGKRK